MSEVIWNYLELAALKTLSPDQLIDWILKLQERDKEFVRNYLLGLENLKEKDRIISEINKLNRKLMLDNDKLLNSLGLKAGKYYDINETWIDKIIYTLKSADHALLSSEIIQFLVVNDPKFSSFENKQKVLSAYLRQAVKYGRITCEKQKGQNRNLYSLPKEK